MAEAARPFGALMRLRPRAGVQMALHAHLRAWHRTAGRKLPGTRLHLLLDEAAPGQVTALHLFENEAAFRRAAGAPEHQTWLIELNALLEGPADVTIVAVAWNAATEARPRVSVSIDRDVHATVQDLIAQLLARHPRTGGENLYLSLLQSVADEYEADYPATAPEEGELR